MLPFDTSPPGSLCSSFEEFGFGGPLAGQAQVQNRVELHDEFMTLRTQARTCRNMPPKPMALYSALLGAKNSDQTFLHKLRECQMPL